jgi:hypothetical protein
MAPLTNWTRVFYAQAESDRAVWTYTHTIAIWRLLWNGGKQRAIMREPLTPEAVLPTMNGRRFDFLVMGGPCRDPSDLLEGVGIANLYDCEINRKWMPNVTASKAEEAARLDYWVEFDCLGGIQIHNNES